MSMDVLQEKIRKMKCPIVLDLTVQPQQIPADFHREDPAEEMAVFCAAMLAGLRATVPGVRFSFDQFALLGPTGLQALSRLLQDARGMGYYVLLDGPAVITPWAAKRAAMLLSDDSIYPCDGLILDGYIGTDAIRPFQDVCKNGKTLFVTVRTPNRSAAELQDLMIGTRLVHGVAADMVNRVGQSIQGKCGYSQMGLVTSATSANAVSGLRSKYKNMFLLVDGLDYPGGNGKNASFGFDRFGHGCALSVGPSIYGAWQEEGKQEQDAVQQAQRAAERIRNNMSRYITIL